MSRPRPGGRLGGLAGGVSRTRPRGGFGGLAGGVSRPRPRRCPGPHQGDL